VQIGLALILELGFNAPTKGAIATGALVNGFPGMDAPARPRAAWRAATAPLVGLAAAFGVLSSQTAVTAVLGLGQRALGTALGILIAFLAWRLWPNPRSALDLASQPNMGGAKS